MGMTIEEAIKRLGDVRRNYDKWSGLGLTPNESEAFRLAIDTMRKYQQLQTDYENRLKADMVAMLKDIRLEIMELDTPNNGSAYMDCVDIIQQKINALKGE